MIRFIFLVAVAFGSSVSAHQDTRLELNGSKITGLPDRYESAQFVDEGKALVVNGKKLDFPEHIIRVLSYDPKLNEKDEPNPYDVTERVVDLSSIELWSSWYHFPSRLPPYLSIRKTDEENGIGLSVLIN